MTLSEEQVNNIKEQLINQIKSTLPAEQQGEAISQIESMNSEALEEFLIKNNMIKNSDSESDGQQCVFCQIISGKIPSIKISENENSLAILEINPISKGHVLILPKKHETTTQELPKITETISQLMSQKIKSTLNPKDLLVSTSNIMGHEVLNLIPIYTNETKDSPRKKASEKELQELQKELSPSNSNPKTKPEEQACVACSIISGKIPTYKIDENKQAIATLEINPVSRGHVLIIPKEHVTSSGKIPRQAFTLAKKISQKIKSNFKPKEVKIENSILSDHEIINVFPVYTNETLSSPRKKIEEKSLIEIQKLLEKKISQKKKTTNKKKKEPEKLWLPRRTP